MSHPSSHRPTREWPLFILAVALVGAVFLPLWQWHSGQHPPPEGASFWTSERLGRLFLGLYQILCYIAFVWALFILGGRYVEVRRQRRAFAFDLLPKGEAILADHARDLQRRVEHAAGQKPYLLVNMLRLALAKFATSRSARDVADIVRTQADVDMSRLVSSMAMVNYLAWAIPAIGFLGTVHGLAGSLSMGERTGDLEVTKFMKEATGHLNFAFDCTLIALALSVALMFALHAVQREEESLVIDCQQYCLDHLVGRLYEVGRAGPWEQTQSFGGTRGDASFDLTLPTGKPQP